MAVIVIVMVLVALAVGAVRWGDDSRDPSYSLFARPDSRPTGARHLVRRLHDFNADQVALHRRWLHRYGLAPVTGPDRPRPRAHVPQR